MPKSRSQCRQDKQKAEIGDSDHSNDVSDVEIDNSSSSDCASDLELILQRKYTKLKNQMNECIVKKKKSDLKLKKYKIKQHKNKEKVVKWRLENKNNQKLFRKLTKPPPSRRLPRNIESRYLKIRICFRPKNLQHWGTISPQVQSFIDAYNLIVQQFPSECYQSTDQSPELSTFPQIDIICLVYNDLRIN